jgi:hypothetical protein
MALPINLTVPGNILWCINWPKCPEKPRPVLVLRRVNDIDGVDWVYVAYGTGQRTSEKNGKINNLVLEINSNECHSYNLSEATAFHFKQAIPLKLNSDNFTEIRAKLKTVHLNKSKEIFLEIKPNLQSIIL